MSDKTELKPCPFCGSNKIEYEFSGFQGRIICNNCGVSGPETKYGADPFCDSDPVFNSWNRRESENDEYHDIKIELLEGKIMGSNE